ncbi:MAG: vWA domain-containing protein, partial [Candidatus Binatus sp.]
MFDRPYLLWLLVLVPLAATPGILAMRAGLRLAGAAAATLRAACVVALVAMLAGLRIPGRIAARSVVVVAALDESRSVSPDQQDWMRSQIERLKSSMAPTDRLAIVGFGRDARLLAPLTDPRLLGHFGDGVDGGATNIAGALTAAESLFPSEADKRIVLLSDGNETEDSAMTEVPAMLEDDVRIFAAAPPPSASERIAVTNFYSPDTVRADQQFAFRIDVESESQSPVVALLKLDRDGVAVGGESITLKPGLNRFELPYRLARPGAYLMSAEVSIAAPRVALNPRVEAAISVTGAPRILIASATPPESLVTALKMRNYAIDFVSPRSLSEHPVDYLPYQLVILDDVPEGSLTAAAQRALNRYVAD